MKSNNPSKQPKNWQLPISDAAPFDPLLGALLILAKLNNRPTSAQSLTAGLPLEGHKLTPDSFKRAAERIGLSSKIIRARLGNIKEQQLPLVLLLENSAACVITEIDSDKKIAQIVHPESGEGFSEMPLDDLAKNYTGFAIFVKPIFKFDEDVNEVAAHEVPKHWFWQIMSKTIPFYSNVLVASFLINLFAIASPLFIMNVYDRVVPNAAMPTLWVLAIGVAIVFAFDFLLRNLRSFFIDSVGRGVDTEVSRDTFEHLLGLQMSSVPSSSGTLAHSVHTFQFFRDFITSASISLLVDIPFAIMFVLVMAFLAGTVALVPIVIAAIIVAISFATQSRLRSLVDQVNRFNAEKQKVLIESLGGIETIKCMRAEGLMQRKWETITKYIAKFNAKIKMLANIGVNSAIYAQHMAMVAVVIAGTYKIAAGDLTTGGLIACVILVSRALMPVSQVAILLTRFRQSKNALENMDNVMQMPVERSLEQNFLHRPKLKGAIEFKDVIFSYPEQGVLALNKMSFKVAPGEKVGFIGRTGSGKSTIEKLILKLYAPTSGSVLIDGVDINQVDPAELRHHIGYIPQDVVLFNGTIRDNISITAPYIDDNMLLRAVKMSGLQSFVVNHPQGLDRMIADRGQNLSGGQKQAIAIARAMLLGPQVLLFDEPCASMDDRAKAAFIHNMRVTMADRTLVLTTHHHSLLNMVDRLIVVDSGKVVLDGPRQEVLDKLRAATQEAQTKMRKAGRAKVGMGMQQKVIKGRSEVLRAVSGNSPQSIKMAIKQPNKNENLATRIKKAIVKKVKQKVEQEASESVVQKPVAKTISRLAVKKIETEKVVTKKKASSKSKAKKSVAKKSTAKKIPVKKTTAKKSTTKKTPDKKAKPKKNATKKIAKNTTKSKKVSTKKKTTKAKAKSKSKAKK